MLICIVNSKVVADNRKFNNLGLAKLILFV